MWLATKKVSKMLPPKGMSRFQLRSLNLVRPKSLFILHLSLPCLIPLAVIAERMGRMKNPQKKMSPNSMLPRPIHQGSSSSESL